MQTRMIDNLNKQKRLNNNTPMDIKDLIIIITKTKISKIITVDLRGTIIIINGQIKINPLVITNNSRVIIGIKINKGISNKHMEI